METKTCTKCEKTKPVDAFYLTHVKATDKRVGYTYVRSMCKACTKVVSDTGYQKRKGTPKNPVIRKPLPTREEMQAWFSAGCPIGYRQAS